MESMEEKPSELIARYVELRDQRKIADERFAEFRKEEYDAPMQTIENQLLDLLNRMGSDSIKSSAGTAYRKLSTSVTTADASEFRRHVIGLESWELVDWRPNKTAINDLVAEGQPLPPGINRSQFYNVHVLKGSKR